MALAICSHLSVVTGISVTNFVFLFHSRCTLLTWKVKLLSREGFVFVSCHACQFGLEAAEVRYLVGSK